MSMIHRLLEQFSIILKVKLAQRGLRGYLAIAKYFENFDETHSGSVDTKVFIKGLKDFRFEINETEANKMLELFDLTCSSKIAFKKFLRICTGELSEFRHNIIINVFSKLASSTQSVQLQLLKKYFTAKAHPDVRLGKKKRR